MPPSVSSYAFPASGLGFARDASLAAFDSAGYLVTADYEQGYVYTWDGVDLSPIVGSRPLLFGSFVQSLLGGQLPTQQNTGGLQFFGGAFGGVSWSNVAYTGSYGLQVEAFYGGLLGWDTSLPSVSLTIAGTEQFTVQFQVLDNTPQQVEIGFYESVHSTWHRVYLGTVDHFGLGGTSLGSVPGTIGSWVTMSFTPSQMGLSAGNVITGMAWGVWQSSGASTIVFSDSTNANATSSATATTGAFIDCDQDGSTGFYALNKVGPLLHVSAPGASAASITLPSTPSNSFTGMVYDSTNSILYIIGNDGTLYKYASSTVSTVAAAPGGVSAPARYLYNNGSTSLYSLFPNSNDLGTFSIGGSSWSFLASPFNNSLDMLYYSTSLSQVIIGGSNLINISVASTINDIAYASDQNQLLVIDDSNSFTAYNGTNGGWVSAQTLAITGAPRYIATTPSGNQALTTDSTNGEVQVLLYTAGLWGQGTPVSLTDPTSLSIYTSGSVTEALICQPTNNTVTLLSQSVNNWNVGQTLSVTGPTSVAVTASGIGLQAIVATSTGVTFLKYNGLDWAVGSSISLSPVPTVTAVDYVNTANPLLYAAGSSGGVTTIYAFQNSAVVGSYTFSGTIASLSVINYQVFATTTSGAINAGYYVNGVTSSALLTPSAPAASVVNTVWVPSVDDYLPLLLIGGANNIYEYINDKPESLARTADNYIATLSGSTWTSVDLVDRNKVSSIATDTSGNIYVVNTANELYKINGTTIQSGYPFLVSPPPGQVEDVSLGLSKLLYLASVNQIVAASSLVGGLCFISGL